MSHLYSFDNIESQVCTCGNRGDWKHTTDCKFQVTMKSPRFIYHNVRDIMDHCVHLIKRQGVQSDDLNQLKSELAGVVEMKVDLAEVKSELAEIKTELGEVKSLLVDFMHLMKNSHS